MTKMTKMTKKNKKVGGWKFSSLFKRKPKQEVIQPTQTTQQAIKYNMKQLTHRNSNNSVIRMFNSHRNNPKLLDRLFVNLCQRKAINYKDNTKEAGKGIAYKACRAIYSNIFNNIDDYIRFEKHLNEIIEDPDASPGQPQFITRREYRTKLLNRVEINKQEQEEAELKNKKKQN